MTGPPTPPPSGDPPRLAVWLAGLRLDEADREFQIGDLIEEFRTVVVPAQGQTAARRWFWRQAIRCVLTRRRRPAVVPVRAAQSTESVLAATARDVAFAARVLRRAPALTGAAVLTLALGLGANVAVFSVAWPLLGERLPFPDEDRMAYLLLSIDRGSRQSTNPISPGDYFDLLEARSFASLAGFNLYATEHNLTGAGEPQQVRVGTVTEGFFGVLGLPPLAGRALDARDFDPGIHSLVLHERAWRRVFGGDPGIIGSFVRLDGVAWTVVGVMPSASSIGTIAVDAWSAQPLDRASARATPSYYLAMIGRLKPDVTLDRANAELATLMRAAAVRYPASNLLPGGTPILARAELFRERLIGPVRPVLILLLGGALLVLAVAAVNLTGLQVARHLTRQPEFAVRRALGAGRGRLVRQLAAEGVLLATAGGLAALGAAAVTLAALARIAPAVGWLDTPALQAWIVWYTLALAGVTGLAIGLGPAIAVSASDPAGGFRARGGTADHRTARLRTLILGTQVAATVVLLTGATLTGASFVQVLRVDPGFDLDRALIADVQPNLSTADKIPFFDALVERVEALPGVERACAINRVPLDNDGDWLTFVADGRTDADRVAAIPMGISEGCLEVLRIPLRRGRPFDRHEAESVAIVNESMAAALWPAEANPIGRSLHIGLASGPLFRVVGVAGDIQATTLESADRRQVWFPASGGWPAPQRLIVRADLPPETLAGPVRTTLASLDRGLALANLRTMGDIVSGATASRRMVLVLLGGFAAIALTLCVVGIAGLLSYQVGQRTREIGIRLALGSSATGVVRVIAAQTFAGVAAGLVAGLVAARLLSALLATQLYEVSPTDLRAYGAVVGVVAAIAALACWPSARRASRVSPVTALRSD